MVRHGDGQIWVPHIYGYQQTLCLRKVSPLLISAMISNHRNIPKTHYNDVIMGAIASQITSLTIVYSIVYSDAYQRKYQNSASLAFVRGSHRGPVNSRTNDQLLIFLCYFIQHVSYLLAEVSNSNSYCLQTRCPIVTQLISLLSSWCHKAEWSHFIGHGIMNVINLYMCDHIPFLSKDCTVLCLIHRMMYDSV